MPSKKDSTTITSLEDVYQELQKEDVTLESKYAYVHPKKTKNRMVTLSLGRCWFNCIMPDEIGLVDEPVNKKKLYSLLNEIYEKLDAKRAVDALSLINKEAFKMSSIHPTTFDVDSCIVPNEIIERRNKELTADTKPEDFANKLKKISEDYVNKNLKGTGIGNIIISGAKGSPVDFGVLTLAKGPTVDIEGNISEPITFALTEGYNGKEYYTGAAEARRALYIRAVGTAEPGYLARTVIYANSNVLVGENDCHTKKYLALYVKSSMERCLLGRYMLNEKTGQLEEITDKSNILNKTIHLRSPLYCKSKKGICKVCYGKLYDKLNTKHLGLVAGSAVNAAGIEGYAMKVRHQSIKVNLKEVDFINDMLQI